MTTAGGPGPTPDGTSPAPVRWAREALEADLRVLAVDAAAVSREVHRRRIDAAAVRGVLSTGSETARDSAPAARPGRGGTDRATGPRAGAVELVAGLQDARREATRLLEGLQRTRAVALAGHTHAPSGGSVAGQLYPLTATAVALMTSLDAATHALSSLVGTEPEPVDADGVSLVVCERFVATADGLAAELLTLLGGAVDAISADPWPAGQTRRLYAVKSPHREEGVHDG
ncbi:hypothetical protein [Ornithinimicrobium cavernae]|uniref:hypothetical protein n=1 Tax=Ornithinimicrobium cavernae TaxID=2666047 RepID=UPI0012B16A36|nr:hypothetical protein [Ornithinimicrobium cavernae]